MRPLDQLRTIKGKLGVVIVGAVIAAVGALVVTNRLDIPLKVSAPLAALGALVVVQLLARGMTSPLREMARAAAAMAKGDYSQRVRASSRDEVGQLATAFNRMAAELAETDRVRRDLVANVSHELRTPIAALQAVLENLVDGVDEPDPATLKTMLRQTERLSRLAAQLLDLSRLESGAVALRRRPVALGELVGQAVEEAGPLATGVELSWRVEPPWLELHGDPERLHQVVTNLLENAIRFSPEGGEVQVTAAQDAGLVRLEVSDEGPGIPPEQAARVFERFTRLDQARSSRDGGAGLGLAIVRWVVELHGGRVSARSGPDGGCRMVVTLPVRPSFTDTPERQVERR
jgi:signal transduction histidine kinase